MQFAKDIADSFGINRVLYRKNLSFHKEIFPFIKENPSWAQWKLIIIIRSDYYSVSTSTSTAIIETGLKI